MRCCMIRCVCVICCEIERENVRELIIMWNEKYTVELGHQVTYCRYFDCSVGIYVVERESEHIICLYSGRWNTLWFDDVSLHIRCIRCLLKHILPMQACLQIACSGYGFEFFLSSIFSSTPSQFSCYFSIFFFSRSFFPHYFLHMVHV